MMNQYSTYKPSGIDWIGDIPQHWDVKRLKFTVTKVGSGITPSGGASVYRTEGIPLLRSQNIYFDGLRLDDVAYITKEVDDSMSNSRVRGGDVLLNITGGSIGRCYFLPENFGPANVNQHVCIIRPAQSQITTKFLYLLLCSPIGQTQIDLLQTGANREGLNFEQLKNFSLPLPPLQDQAAIARYLDEKTAQLDTLIERKRRLITLLREEKTALINEAVTKGIHPDVPMKDSGIEWLGEIPAHWDIKRLKYPAWINPQKGASDFDKGSDESVVFLPMERVSENGEIDCELRKPISEVWNGFTYFEKDDVLLAKITPCFENGKGALLNDLKTQVGFGSTEFHVLRTKPDILPEFLFLITRTNPFKNIGEASMTGAAGQKRVPTSFIENYLAALPPLVEQAAIARYLDTETAKIDHTVTRIEREIELMKEYRTALISEVVTGKVKVV